jgi:hypothetical protein
VATIATTEVRSGVAQGSLCNPAAVQDLLYSDGWRAKRPPKGL